MTLGPLFSFRRQVGRGETIDRQLPSFLASVATPQFSTQSLSLTLPLLDLPFTTVHSFFLHSWNTTYTEFRTAVSIHQQRLYFNSKSKTPPCLLSRAPRQTARLLSNSSSLSLPRYVQPSRVKRTLNVHFPQAVRLKVSFKYCLKTVAAP